MKSLLYIAVVCLAAIAFSSCEKRDYDAGLPQFDHHYYAAYLPNTNTGVSVVKSQAAPIKFAVQFYSAFTREYDAVANYAIVTTGIPAPAVAGVDFNIVDKNGAVIQPVNGKYSMVFPKAVKIVDTIYVKLLNNPAPGIRKMEVQIVENKTDQFYVDIFSTAFRRPVEIK